MRMLWLGPRRRRPVRDPREQVLIARFKKKSSLLHIGNMYGTGAVLSMTLRVTRRMLLQFHTRPCYHAVTPLPVLVRRLNLWQGSTRLKRATPKAQDWMLTSREVLVRSAETAVMLRS